MRASPSWVPPVAQEQAGAFTRAQAHEAGLSANQIYHRVRTGRWVPAIGAALRSEDEPESPEMLLSAVALTWPDAVVCRSLAGKAFDLPVPDFTVVDACVPSMPRHRHRLRAHRVDLGRQEVVRSLGARLTSPRRTLVDLLAHLPRDDAWDLLAWAVTRDRVSAQALEAHLVSHPRRKGARQLRFLARMAREGALSEAERRLHVLLRRAGISGWRPNVRVHDRSGRIGVVDVLFPEARLVVEVDGWRSHGKDRFQSDRTRQNRLVAAGFRVLRFTWDDITLRPQAVLAQIRTLLAVA